MHNQYNHIWLYITNKTILSHKPSSKNYCIFNSTSLVIYKINIQENVSVQIYISLESSSNCHAALCCACCQCSYSCVSGQGLIVNHYKANLNKDATLEGRGRYSINSQQSWLNIYGVPNVFCLKQHLVER